ncbi:MAG: hypothetical protein NC203_02825 [Firmicutes bacterium]|nr:hypothetical protein [[Eubacterium] siraeum]MCM1487278.1 hypothetical protein [Bacillota bacterium]
MNRKIQGSPTARSRKNPKMRRSKAEPDKAAPSPRKKILSLTAVLSAALLLSGCTVFDTSLEGLLSAPKLTRTQTEIYDALLLGLGGEAELVYPRSGNYRSAIILKNLDDEETEEAIVFYREKTVAGQLSGNQGEGGIRMGFLDKREDKWETVIDCPIDGADIESLEFYGFDDKVTIGISCSVLSQTERSLRLMQYREGGITNVFSGNYSFMSVEDLDQDGFDELFYVNYDSLVGYNSAKIWGLSAPDEDGGEQALGEISSVPLYTDITSVQNMTMQSVGLYQKYIYLDYFKGDNTYGTQLLFSYKNLLSSPYIDFEVRQDETFPRRNNQFMPLLYSEDIDGDGQIEIPSTEPITGYEVTETSDQLYFVRWYGIKRDYEYDSTVEMHVPMERKYLSYCDSGGEYIFYIPVRWQGLITAEKEGNIITFYKYDRSETLLSICVSKEGIPKGERWRRFGSVGSSLYVNQPASSLAAENSMALTEDELNSCLQLRNREENASGSL